MKLENQCGGERQETQTEAKLEEKLQLALELTKAGWDHFDPPGTIAKHDESGSQKSIDVDVWFLMRAITMGIGLKSRWDRDQAGTPQPLRPLSNS